MIHFIEKLRQIDVYNPPLPRELELLRFPDRVVRSPSRSEAIAVRRKLRLEYRAQNLMKCLLDEPIHDRRYAELPLPTIGFRNLDTSHNLGPLRTRQQPFLDLEPVRLKPGLQVFNTHLVDSRRSFVPHHPRISFEHVPAFDQTLDQLRRFGVRRFRSRIRALHPCACCRVSVPILRARRSRPRIRATPPCLCSLGLVKVRLTRRSSGFSPSRPVVDATMTSADFWPSISPPRDGNSRFGGWSDLPG